MCVFLYMNSTTHLVRKILRKRNIVSGKTWWNSNIVLCFYKIKMYLQEKTLNKLRRREAFQCLMSQGCIGIFLKVGKLTETRGKDRERKNNREMCGIGVGPSNVYEGYK